jgi:membrane-bound lytic murein transglycosylase A
MPNRREMIRRLPRWVGVLCAVVAVISGCHRAVRIPDDAEVTAPPKPTPIPEKTVLRSTGPAQGPWAALPGWENDQFSAVWPAVQAECQLNNRGAVWANICKQATQIDGNDSGQVRWFFEQYFQPRMLTKDDGGNEGLLTGYYEPELSGSRQRQGRFQVPLYKMPEVWKRKAGPLPARDQLLKRSELVGQELVYVEDPVEAAFLQIQGSGKIRLPDGNQIRLGFAGTNDQPFKSFARWLLDKKAITPKDATMQGIKAWAQANPNQVETMLNINPRYVFFKELSVSGGPIGALAVPLTAGRSIAVDTSYVPLGAPVFIATTYPMSSQPLQRLVMAQDVGTAIRGAVRADFYWGSGSDAGELAGKTKQALRMWVLSPR